MIHFANSVEYKEAIDEGIRLLYDRHPILLETFGERGIEKCREDNVHHFHYLETATALSNKDVFLDYALWLNNVLVSRGMKTAHIIDNFECLIEAIPSRVSHEKEGTFIAYLVAANELLRDHAEEPS